MGNLNIGGKSYQNPGRTRIDVKASQARLIHEKMRNVTVKLSGHMDACDVCQSENGPATCQIARNIRTEYLILKAELEDNDTIL